MFFWFWFLKKWIISCNKRSPNIVLHTKGESSVCSDWVMELKWKKISWDLRQRARAKSGGRVSVYVDCLVKSTIFLSLSLKCQINLKNEELGATKQHGLGHGGWYCCNYFLAILYFLLHLFRLCSCLFCCSRN